MTSPTPTPTVLDLAVVDAPVVLTDGDDRRHTTLQTVARSGGTIVLVLQLDGTEPSAEDRQNVASHVASQGHPIQAPGNLVVSDDGSLLNYRGTNYVPQPSAAALLPEGTTPAYVHVLLDAILLDIDSLDFRGAAVPADVQQRLTEAVADGQIAPLHRRR